MIRLLRANRRKHGVHHPLLAIDIENDPTTGAFICAGVYGDIRHRTSHRDPDNWRTVIVDWTTRLEDRYFTDQAEFVQYLTELKANSCMLIFFNLSYDKPFFDAAVDHGSVLAAGARVITLKLKGNGIKAIDLANHVDGSLADWIGHLDMTAKYGIAKAELKAYRARVMNDVRATYQLGTFIEDFYFYECGIPLTVTVGSAAMRLFTMKHFTDYWKREDDFMAAYERNAYYGGRVEVFQRGTFDTWGYDVNSGYVSIMRDCELPDMATGRYIETPPQNWQRYLRDFMGIWQVRVRCPLSLSIPVLPFKVDGKLKFCVGEFRGYYTSVELNVALAAGYEILEVYDFIYYRRSKLYFRSYAEFIWRKRVEYKAAGNRGMDLLIKKMGNALYGKFAQRNSHDYFGRLADFDGELPPAVKFYERPGGETWVLCPGEKTPATFEFPAISAFIAAYARLKLWAAMAANARALIYCDTDSIKLTAPATGVAISRGLGDWGIETEGEAVLYHRPKLYGDKRKGVPKRAKLVERTSTGETWIFDKPLREREAIKAALIPGMWVEVTKHLEFADDKRWWFSGHSKPIELNILISGESGSVNHLAIPPIDRYKPKLRRTQDKDERSWEDRAALEFDRLDRRRAGEEIYQRG